MKLALFILGSVSLFGSGSVQQALQKLGATDNYAITLNWTGDAVDGSVPATVVTGMAGLQGYLFTSVETRPGTPAPTNGYTLTLKDPSGYDILGGMANPLSSASTQAFLSTSETPPIQGALTLTIAGQAVASARGVVYIFLSRPSSLAGGNGLFGRFFRLPVNLGPATLAGVTNVNGANTFGFKIKIDNLDPQAERLVMSNVPGTTTDGLTVGIATPANSTQLESKAIFGAITNASVNTNAISGQFFGRASGAGTGNAIGQRVKVWGINTLIEDGSPLGGAPYTGYDWVYLTHEWDMNVFNSKTQVIAHSIGGVWSVQPQTAYGYVVNGTNSAFKWDCGFCLLDGVAAVAMQVGVSSTGNNGGSIPSLYYSRDSGGGVRAAAMSTDPDGNWLFRPGFVNTGGTNPQTIFQDADGNNILGINGAVGATSRVQGSGVTRFQPGTTILASLGTEGGGSMVYCSDCNFNTRPCTGGGAGALAIRESGQWNCP